MNASRSKLVLVTGGAGFIGSHLIDRLLDQGYDVVCVDNLYTGTRHNLDHLVAHPQFRFIDHDVCLPLNIEADEIYNLACPASPIHYQRDPVKTVKTAVLGAINVLDLARRLRVPIFHASTSEVYGSPAVHPQPESYWGNVNPIGPRACYDEGKRCAETLFFDYHRQHGVSIKVGRIFNTYGPRVHPNDGRVVSNFIMQALTNADISIYGEGMQTRSFCFVDDMVEAFLRFMRAPNRITGPLNLGNPEEVTIRGLAELILELSGSRSKLVSREPVQDDPAQRRPDIAEARRLLDWNPTVTLREGLKRTLVYFESLLREAPEDYLAAKIS